MATINVKDAAGSTVALEKPLAPGAALAAASRPVTLATDDVLVTAFGAKTDAKSTATDGTSTSAISIWKQISASIQSLVTALGSTAFDLGVGTGGTRTLRVAVDSSQTDGAEYETVAASQTNQVMGATGAAGDFLSHVIVSPGTAGCGVVTILDNATTIVAFAGGGTTALSNLIPFIIPVGITSTSGAWKITTGANVTCVAVGNFT